MILPGLCFPDEKTAIDPDAFFARPGSHLHQQARELCMACPLYFECQDFARTEGIPYGIFGGETKGERNRHWVRKGGRPTNFADSIQAQANILLQERRDHDNFDSQHEGVA